MIELEINPERTFRVTISAENAAGVLEHPFTCLATTAYVYALLCLHVTIFSNGSIIPPGFKSTELLALTLAARSYALLACKLLAASSLTSACICVRP